MVDDAHILSPATKASLESQLADLERKSTIQLVVATIPSLAGQDVETYANTLFRHWSLGQAQKNNGVLFVIAPSDHKMRIEVGYGLEGTLTDATSKLIIANAAAPRFKKGDYDGGVSRAVEDIVTALTVDAAEWKPEMRSANKPPADIGNIATFVIFLFIIFMIWSISRRGRRTGGAWVVPISTGGGSSGGWSSGGSSDSGFSGGGGSSGGGGASGDW